MPAEDSKLTAAKIGAGGTIIGSLIGAVANVYQTERTIRANRERDEKQRELQKKLEKSRHRNQQQLARKAFERQKQLQQELAAYNRQTQLEIAAEQRKTALESVEANELFENWPLRIVPSHILNSHRGDGPIPLHIIPVPPVVDFDQFATNAEEFPRIEKYLAEGLRQFLHQNYSLNNILRPVELLDGAWDSNRYHGGSSIKALFSMLQSEPILILESEIDGDYLNFRLGYWGLGQENYYYAPVISQLPFREMIYESAQTRALAWKADRDKILALGQDPKVINELDTYNLEIIEQEARLQSSGIDTSKLSRRYRGNKQDFKAFADFLVKCNCLVAGWIADAHHLIQSNVTPLLPQLLPELAGDAPEEMVQSILSEYGGIYQSLEGERLEIMPELLLEFAHSLKALPDKSWARSQVDDSVKSWLKLRGMTFEEGTDVIEAMQPLLMLSEDWQYVENVAKCLTAIGDESTVSRLQAPLYQSALAYRKQGDYQSAIAALDQAIRLNPNEAKIQDFRQQLPKSAGSYEFDVITVNFFIRHTFWEMSIAEEIKRKKGEAQYFTEDLGNGITLDMVYIPGGKFKMGTKEKKIERLVKKFDGKGYRREKPLHKVTVQPFFMGKFQVTQAQWKAIASLPKVERDLDSDPSYFKDDNRPVERVNWYDAVEFCARLCKKTGREYRLPSEVEWEYACRAGTKTPFHFGETITGKLANYDASYTYADELEEKYRTKTTQVGQFPPNAFGLYDMHGNVWEWCADTWHDNYEGSPTDGSAWTQGGNETFSPLRGGSWHEAPSRCRSAYRSHYVARVDIDDAVGFRVGCGVGTHIPHFKT